MKTIHAVYIAFFANNFNCWLNIFMKYLLSTTISILSEGLVQGSYTDASRGRLELILAELQDEHLARGSKRWK